jgi:hypothetical protein
MKKVFWALIFAATAGIVWWFSQDTFIPDSTVISAAAVFDGPEGFRERLEQDLTQELRTKSVVIWGQWPEDVQALEALEEFLKPAPGAQLGGISAPAVPRFSQVWIDDQFQERLPGRKVYLRGRENTIVQDVSAAIANGEKLLILTSPIFAATMLKGTPAFALSQSEIDFIGLLIVDGPRQRVQEEQEDPKVPCALPHSDRTGTGALGCRILQSARASYRKTFPSGSRVLQIEKLNTHDYLILRSQEVNRDN